MLIFYIFGCEKNNQNFIYMKKIFLSMAAVAMIFASCSDEAITENDDTIQAMELDESVKSSFV